jgi:hypothetical protein
MMSTPRPAQLRRPDGPNAGILAIVATVLAVLGIVLPALLANGQFAASPLESTGAVAEYYRTNPAAATVGGFLVFGGSVPLGIYAATVYARLLKLGIRVPGPNIAFFGGITASILVGMAGLLTWVLGQPVAGQSAATIHTVAYAIFAFGGVGFVGGLGLLIAGIAVPTLILRLAPRWIAWSGLVLAAISELSFLSLLIPGFTVALPLGRFLGLLWLIVIGFLLPRDRREVARPDRSEKYS